MPTGMTGGERGRELWARTCDGVGVGGDASRSVAAELVVTEDTEATDEMEGNTVGCEEPLDWALPLPLPVPLGPGF